MEEDIKIIEEMLNSKEPVCNYKLKHQEIEAISNLLAGYKELEEENKQLEAIKDEAIRRYNFESIPKSLVKEKIEELKQKAISYGTFIDKDESFNIQSKISVLQDLLGEE